ncbi:MAG: lysophospholipid acyltransferase family protein [Chloroflexi bacterium]|nr:lysophospholipid acyltransferase family protein [Chloroflexota bacterium]
MILVYWFWRVGMFLAGVAPRRLSQGVAAALGTTAYYVLPKRRAVAKENFSHVLGKSPSDPEVRRVARRSLRNYACYLRDVMIYPSLSIAELEQRITIRNPEHIDEALAPGKGMILVSAHFGNMDLPSAVLARKFTPIALVSETLRPRQLMDHLTRVRGVRNVHMHPYDRAPRRIFEALKRNETAAFLIDFGITHHFDIHTVPVTFFGTQTKFPSGPAQLAVLSGAPIVVGHAWVDSSGHIMVETTPPLKVERNAERQRTLQVAMQEVARRMEDFIRAHPDQWYMFRPMWRPEAAGITGQARVLSSG